MADVNITELTKAINELNKSVKTIGDLGGKFEGLSRVIQENVMQRQDGKGRYPGYSRNYFGESSNYEEAKFRRDQAAQLNKNSRNVFGRLFGFGDAMYKSSQLKEFQHELEKTTKELEKQKDIVEETKEEVKKQNKAFEDQKKLLDKRFKDKKKEKAVLEDLESGKNVEDILGKHKLTKRQTEELLKLSEEKNKLQAKENDLEEKETKLLDKQGKQYENQTNLIEQKTDAISRGFQRIKQGGRDLLRIGKQFADAWMKVDTASANFARSVGMGGRGMAAMRNNTIKTIQNSSIATDYGIESPEELLKLRQGYSTAIGRNNAMSSFDINNAAALSVVMGEKGGQLAASLENFGLSYSEAAERAGKMYKDAGKYGLSFEKYSENFLQNIKMAQNYTFKNGLKGLENMAKKATAMKIDMQQMASFADKVGTLQGAVETSAQLQVLGGPFAQFSDPLGMLNESMTDMEGLMDRFTKMIGGLSRFDSTTGQIDVSTFNRQRIRAAAQAMGMDYGQVMESVLASGRRDYISEQVKNRKDFSDEDKEFIKNTASVSGGTAFVTYFDEFGKSISKNVKEMSKEELNFARAQNQTEADNIRDIAKDTRTLAQQIAGTKAKVDATRAAAVEKVQGGIKNVVEKIGKNIEILVWANTIGGLFGVFKEFVGGFSTMFMGGRGLGGGSAASQRLANIRSAGGGTTASFGTKSVSGLGSGIKEYGKNLAAKGGKFSGKVGSKLVKLGRGLIKNAGKIAKVGKVGVPVLSGAIEGVSTGFNEFKKGNDYGKNAKGKSQNWKKYGRTGGAAGGAAIGTAIGAALLPTGIGTIPGLVIMGASGAIGAALGKNAGGGFANQKRRERKKMELGLEGLNGDYSTKELKAIANGQINEKIKKKIEANDDASLVNSLKNITVDEQNTKVNNAYIYPESSNIATPNGFSEGGPIGGNSKNGDKLWARVNSGEAIFNGQQLKGLFNIVKSAAIGGVMKPRMLMNGGMLSVKPVNEMSVFNKQRLQALHEAMGGGTTSANVNINGSIKLDAGNGVSVDILSDLVKNPVFVRQITKLIEKQMTTNTKGGNVVNKGLYWN